MAHDESNNVIKSIKSFMTSEQKEKYERFIKLFTLIIRKQMGKSNN